MTSGLVLATIEAPIGRITLNNPERRNALSLSMMRELASVLISTAARSEVSAIILDGAGPAFSAGHDLREMQALDSEAEFDTLFGACVDLMQTVRIVEVPIIAKVHGVATAAGCQLVAACDLAVCATAARFATPGVNIGLFCSTPMVPLSRSIGRKRAMEMLLTGTMIDAATALDWGLVNRVVDAVDLDTAADELASQIAKASRTVVALGKRTFWEQIDRSEADAYAHTAPVMTANALMPDAAEGIAAFLDKRAPTWPTEPDTA